MEAPSPIMVGQPGKPNSVDFWLKRLYQNSFTRNGRQYRVRSWSVKIQHGGIRKAVTLKAQDKLEAAQEALTLFQSISQHGWHQVLREYQTVSRKENCSPDEMVEYWKSRLLTRRYIDIAKGSRSPEYSVRIEHKGTYHYFLLGTEKEEAARTAAAIYRRVLEAGWDDVRRLYQREFTLSIFWSNNPLACTYTTLVTNHSVGNEPTPSDGLFAEKGLEVWFVGEDQEVGRAVSAAINYSPTFYCGKVLRGLDVAYELLQTQWPGILLINRDVPQAKERITLLKGRCPELPVYLYGIYEESEQIFASFAGIKAGYILQRRNPKAILSPLEKVSTQVPLVHDLARKHIQHYFQQIFQEGSAEDDLGNLSLLTAREQEIMTYLPHGLLDKEIAEILHVSYWTVHNHLKKIYHKLGVHNRTEAVVKFLSGPNP